MPPSPIERIDISAEELEALLEQARPSLPPEGYEKLRAAIRTLGYVTELLAKNETTLAALRDLLCPASTEKTAKVLQQAGLETEKMIPLGGRSAAGQQRDRRARPEWCGGVSRSRGFPFRTRF